MGVSPGVRRRLTINGALVSLTGSRAPSTWLLVAPEEHRQSPMLEIQALHVDESRGEVLPRWRHLGDTEQVDGQKRIVSIFICVYQ